MPKIINAPANKGVILQVSVTTAIPANSRIGIRISGVPENNIKLLASAFIYQNLSTSEPAEFFAYELGIVRQRRTIFYLPRLAPVGDILRVIPLYDFTLLECWVF